MNNNFKKIIETKLSSDVLNLISELNFCAQKLNLRLYFVGGIVRDLIMGVDVSDIDILVEGSAIEFCSSCDICQILSIHKDFGTVKCKVRGYDIDFASTRCESYPQSGCLPEVNQIGVSLDEDVKRRDFTVNAIALSLDNFELIDYFCGMSDIQNKTLKILHKDSFIDDPTRILRGLDFSIRFGFGFDKITKSALDSYLEQAPRLREGLSLSRVELTLDKVLSNNDVAYNKIIENKYYKIFRDDVPSISSAKILDASNIFSQPFSHIAKFILLNSFSVPEADFKSDYDIYLFFKKYSDFELALFYAFDVYSNQVLKYYSDLKDIALNLSGADLITLGFEQGKRIGEILDKLLEYRINSKNILTKDEEIAFVIDNFKK